MYEHEWGKNYCGKKFYCAGHSFQFDRPATHPIKRRENLKNKSTAVAQNEKSVRNRKNNNTVVVSVKVQERRNDGS
jgi:hypothetical protein